MKFDLAVNLLSQNHKQRYRQIQGRKQAGQSADNCNNPYRNIKKHFSSPFTGAAAELSGQDRIPPKFGFYSLPGHPRRQAHIFMQRFNNIFFISQYGFFSAVTVLYVHYNI